MKKSYKKNNNLMNEQGKGEMNHKYRKEKSQIAHN